MKEITLTLTDDDITELLSCISACNSELGFGQEKTEAHHLAIEKKLEKALTDGTNTEEAK